MWGLALGGAAQKVAELGQAGYGDLEELGIAALIDALGKGVYAIPGLGMAMLPGGGLLRMATSGGITPFTAPILEEKGLIEGDPSQVGSPALTAGLFGSLGQRLAQSFDRGGVVPEDIEGEGPSGTRYRIEKGEKIMPARNEDSYFQWGPMDKPSLGARLGGFFGDPRVQLALAQMGQAVSPPGTVGERLGGFAATGAQAVMTEQHQIKTAATAKQEYENILLEARQQWEKEKKKEHDDRVKKALEQMKTQALQTGGPIPGQAAAPSIGPSLGAYGEPTREPIAPF